MPDRLDCELRAIEAERHAETASTQSLAQNWRDIAHGFRLLSAFLAEAHPSQADHVSAQVARLRSAVASGERPGD
jgi:hypothetical protein